MPSAPSVPWSDQWCQKHHRWLLLAITLILYIPGTGTIPLMDRDEPRFAHATVEMMQRGSWAIPYFNEEYRFDKPPLTYWWMAAHYQLFGVNELAARLHSVVSVYLIALVLAAFGTRMAGARAGLLAGFAWVTSLQVIVHGRLCVADMPMVLFVTLSSWALYELLTPEEGPVARLQSWRWVFYVSMGLGFLAKGPIAWFVPILTLLLWRYGFQQGRPLPWKRLGLWPGALIALLITAAWGVPALMATHGDYWRSGIGEHVVKRGTDIFNGRIFIPGLYFATAFLSLFPWIGFIIPLWRNLRAHWSPQNAFLVSWLVAPQVIFFFYATQLPHYPMPGFPAFSLLVAMFLTGSNRPKEGPGLLAALCLLLAALGGALWWFAPRSGADAALIPVLEQGGLLLAGLGLISWMGMEVGLKGKGPATAIIAGVAVLILSSRIMHVADELRLTNPAINVAAAMPRLGDTPTIDPSKQKRIGYVFAEPSLVFYAGYPWSFAGKQASAEKMFAQAKSGATLVVLDREWTLSDWFKSPLSSGQQPSRDQRAENDALLQRYPAAGVEEVTGLDLARSSWVELRVIVRGQ